MDSTVLGLAILGIFALPFVKQRWSLVASYVVGTLMFGYGIALVVLEMWFSEPNPLSGLGYVLGSILIIVGASIVVLARFLYRRANPTR